ncbi:hypothetical protein [Sphingomonas asaccharolytica]|uniref:hypothetical protein n=1 Tax=Sphingomonas asaccharolytica TaxID=40681 RepID=UPI00082F2B16|nr:hypothetical protein [Sphingomonas asaccharolytica]
MMFGFLLLFQAAVATVVPTAVPSDWSKLPDLRLTTTPDYAAIMTKFVHDEIAAGRCATPAPVNGKTSIKVDMVVLISSASGEAVKIVPRAINCPTVEQFAAGVIQKATRGNIAGPPPTADSWYHTGVTLTWGP